ncbi:hypothetical protein Tco_1219820 [Tanacetum coccineum]
MKTPAVQAATTIIWEPATCRWGKWDMSPGKLMAKLFPVDMSSEKSFADTHFSLIEIGVGLTTSSWNDARESHAGPAYSATCRRGKVWEFGSVVGFEEEWWCWAGVAVSLKLIDRGCATILSQTSEMALKLMCVDVHRPTLKTQLKYYPPDLKTFSDQTKGCVREVSRVVSVVECAGRRLHGLQYHPKVSLLKSRPLRIYATDLTFSALPLDTCLDWTRVHVYIVCYLDSMNNGGYNVSTQINQGNTHHMGEDDQIIDNKLAVDAAEVDVNEAKTADGACYLELKVLSRPRRDGCWDFLHRYGYHYGDGIAHPLLP